MTMHPLGPPLVLSDERHHPNVPRRVLAQKSSAKVLEARASFPRAVPMGVLVTTPAT